MQAFYKRNGASIGVALNSHNNFFVLNDSIAAYDQVCGSCVTRISRTLVVRDKNGVV